MVNTILKEADLFCPNSVRINFTIYHIRTYGTQQLLVLNNFSDKTMTVPLPEKFQTAKVLITNEATLTPTAIMTLPPYATIGLLQKA
ncbi:hypothetical protein [Lactobacillus paracasei]|uniref:hypothetical protein n=1 Tax=Lacticaseibacillus paracasei TaxID=1597 RepID=UPI000FFC8246